MSDFKLTLKDRASFERMLGKAQALATGRVSRALMPSIARGLVTQLANEAKSSQVNPQGKAWAPTKSKRPVKWPAQARIVVSVVAGKVVAKVTGPDYLAPQHSGWRRMAVVKPASGRAPRKHFSSIAELKKAERLAQRVAKSGGMRRWRGKPRRILPKKSIPKRWADPIVKALNAGWRSFMSTTSLRGR